MVYTKLAKLQGKDKWPTVLATVTNNEVIAEGYRGSAAKISFTFQDGMGEIQSAYLKADNMSSLYNIQFGDTFELQYNPKNPSKVYTDEANSFYDDLRPYLWLIIALFVLIAATINFLKK